jgi:hypothetical protein
MACELHSAYADARVRLPRLTTRQLIEIATGQGSVQERALALWYALGTDRDRSSLAPQRGDPPVVFDQPCQAGWPHTIVEVAREGFRRTRTVLCPLVALLACEPRQAAQMKSDDLPAEDMIGDVPAWALDVYTRESRAAFARLLETNAAAARWIQGKSPRRWLRLPGALIAVSMAGNCRIHALYVAGGVSSHNGGRILFLLRQIARLAGGVSCGGPALTGRLYSLLPGGGGERSESLWLGILCSFLGHHFLLTGSKPNPSHVEVFLFAAYLLGYTPTLLRAVSRRRQDCRVLQRRRATADQIVSTSPNGQAP